MAICAPVIGLWYWCTDQYIVQRALGAPNEQTARRGSIFAAFPETIPRLSFHHSGPDLFRPGQERQGAGAGRGL
jgi:SSS family solute:Na+ symporter